MNSDADRRLIDHLLHLLDVEEIDVDLYRGRNESGRPGRIFGGQVAAQSLVAASRTVRDERRAHSLHGYFLRAGDPTVPVIYTVTRLRDGRSFSTRHVTALQRGKAIFDASISFQIDERGYEHQMAMPDAPDPESLPTREELVERYADAIPEADRHWVSQKRAVDTRHVDLPTYFGGGARHGINLVWFRIPCRIGEDPSQHLQLLTYMSDMTLLDNVVLPHGRRGALGPLMVASIDHALWFHRPVRVDEWLLYVQDSPAASGARGFARGSIFARDGRLVASVAQEGLVRPVHRSEDRSE
ncbi:acyl-CoA thioesterase II [Myxococcota bacterium]|nr:acyl-CoA thioesterase II [Myxococcota bacterium]MCZ7620131.1 acyl-CoA thioesterase II [Myxococcota bacterium]